MKIALCSPAGAMHRYNGSFGKSLHYAPLTLTLLAALVPAELDAEIVLYDETAGPIPTNTDADLVCMTCITGTAERTYKFADYFRSCGKTVILGGVHPSLCPDEAAAHADSIIIGLGEENFPLALRDYAAGNLKPRYIQDKCTDIAGRPLPRRDLLNRKKYITLNTVEAVRGCNMNCAFCAYPAAFGRRIFERPVEDVVAEIKTLRGKLVIFPDVNLIADIDYAKRLFTAMIPLKKWWFGLTTTAVGNDGELMDLMRRSGCRGLLLGFESVDQNAMKQLHKGVNRVGGYDKLMSELHRRGIVAMGCFAFGADSEDGEIFMQTAEFCENIKLDLPRFSLITPFPGTTFYRQLEAEGRITERNWALYDVEHCVFKPKQMSADELTAGIEAAWRHVYSWRSIFRRYDWKNTFRIGFVGTLAFILTNIGYRKYARRFGEFDSGIMTDNSDIPDAAVKENDR